MLKFELVKDKSGTWNDVRLFGKKIAEQSWGANRWGRYWIWNFTKSPNRFNIYNPFDVILSIFFYEPVRLIKRIVL